MDMVKAITKSIGCVAMAVVPSFVWAQTTSSVFIPITNQTFERLAGDDMARVNLIKEVQKANPSLRSVPNLEIQMLRAEAKSGVGGAQVFLRVNNEMMDSKVVETNADMFNSTDPGTYEKVELKNIDRAGISEASLVIQAFSNIRIRSLEVVLGAIQEPVVFGHYADAQISIIGGAVTANETEGSSELVRPNTETVSAIYNRYYIGTSPVTGMGLVSPEQTVPAQPTVMVRPQPVAAPPVAVAQPLPVRPQPAVPPPPPARLCVRHSAGFDVCMGDTVKNTWGFPGTVVSVKPATREVGVQFDFMGGAVTVRKVDTLKK